MAGVKRPTLMIDTLARGNRKSSEHWSSSAGPSSINEPRVSYQFELGGMLVYDSECLMYSDPSPPLLPPKEPVRPLKYHKSQLSKAPLTDQRAFYRTEFFTSCPDYVPTDTLQVPSDGITLQFDSKFESGNLRKAVKLGDYEYLLVLKSDTNTGGNNHWYYFSVYNPRKTSITFKLCNMLKLDLLYRSGMKPAVYSVKHHQATGEGWHRAGYKLTYTKTPGSVSRVFYTLTFTYDFAYEADTVFFAYAVPYTYTELQESLETLKSKHCNVARVSPLCRSLGGNVCDMVTITDKIETYLSSESESHLWGISASGRRMLRMRKLRTTADCDEHAEKKGIVITARVHSGETVSSHMMQGVLDFLVSDSPEALLLRRHFVFRLVPMLNPDGVRHGNYRTSLLGVDLNRRWQRPNFVLHPTIYHTKKMIEVFNELHDVSLFCDLHGHTRKRNVFMYGCGVKSLEMMDLRRNLLAKLIPVHFALRNKLFSFEDSHFRMEADKRGTGRIVVFSEFGIPHSYTMEASFYGPSTREAFGKAAPVDMHMTPAHLQGLGADLCQLCMTFANQGLYFRRVVYTNNFLRKLLFARTQKAAAPKATEFTEETKNEVKAEPETAWGAIDVVDYLSSDDNDSGGSNSSASEEEPAPLLPLKLPRAQRHKCQGCCQHKAPPEKLPMRREVTPLTRGDKRFVLKNISEVAKAREQRASRSIGTCKFKLPVSTRNYNDFSLDNGMCSITDRNLEELASPRDISVVKVERKEVSFAKVRPQRWGKTYLRKHCSGPKETGDISHELKVSKLLNKPDY